MPKNQLSCFMQSIRLACCSAAEISCVTMIIVTPLRFIPFIRSYISAVTMGSSPETGSSRSSSFFVAHSALARRTLCC